MVDKNKKKNKKSKGSKKTQQTIKEGNIPDKIYVTRKISTSVTLLGCSEPNIILDSLMFLSHYIDHNENNLKLLISYGILPKLLDLLDHNLCILTFTLRLLIQVLRMEVARLELQQDKFTNHILKICSIFTIQKNVNVKEFAAEILETYTLMNKQEILLQEPLLLPTILESVKNPETELILNCSLSIFNQLLDIESARYNLCKHEKLSLEALIFHMTNSPDIVEIILKILEKLAYFAHEDLQYKFRKCNIVEHVINLVVEPRREQYVDRCLRIILHCMSNNITNSYFVESFEFLKFCNWAKTCTYEAIQICAKIFCDLSQIDSIRQLLFDLSVENTILSFFRSNNDETLHLICETLIQMSKHKFCLEKLVSPNVVEELLKILSAENCTSGPTYEAALNALHNFCVKDSRTIHIIQLCDGINSILIFFKKGTKKLSIHSNKQVLEIIILIISNHQLKNFILRPPLYEAILKQIMQSNSQEILVRCMKILILCLSGEQFREYFIHNESIKVILRKLVEANQREVIYLLTLFIYKALTYEDLIQYLISYQIFSSLKTVPEVQSSSNNLIEMSIKMIYRMFPSLKFYETNCLDFNEKLGDKFYLIKGSLPRPFPFLEELGHNESTSKYTVYVVDYKHNENVIHSTSSVTSVSSNIIKKCLCPGKLSQDPYLPKYYNKIEELLIGVLETEDKIKVVAEFVNKCLTNTFTTPDKLHNFELHIQCLKEKLGTNIIPIGYLRLGFQCEKALLFKALADCVDIPTTFVKGKHKLYWNEIGLEKMEEENTGFKQLVVDLMDDIGQLLPVGSKKCNIYCGLLENQMYEKAEKVHLH